MRERADHRRLFLLGVLTLLAAGAGVFVQRPEIVALGILGVVLLILVRRGRIFHVDFDRGAIRLEFEQIPFRDIESLTFKTGLELKGSRFAAPTGRQVWHLDVETTAGTSARLATHGNERVLLRATRELAIALDRPVLDFCAPDGSVASWHPSRPPRPSRWSTPSPPDSLSEQTVPSGRAIRWNVPWMSAFVVMLMNAGFVAAISYLALVKLNAAWLAVLAIVGLGPYVLRTAGLAAERGWQTVIIGGDVLTIRRGFPLLWSRSIKRSAVSDVRLSQRLVPMLSSGVSMKGLVSVDLMAREYRIASLAMNEEQATWTAARLAGELWSPGGN